MQDNTIISFGIIQMDQAIIPNGYVLNHGSIYNIKGCSWVYMMTN